MASPVAQLYGFQGLKKPTSEREQSKETKWNDDVFGNREKKDPKKKRNTKTTVELDRDSISRQNMPADLSVKSSQETFKNSVSEGKRRQRRQCTNPAISDEDLIMLGMYRFNERQSAVYQNFVEMLSEFDPHDVMNILEDVMHEVNASNGLTSYSGFDN